MGPINVLIRTRWQTGGALALDSHFLISKNIYYIENFTSKGVRVLQRNISNNSNTDEKTSNKRAKEPAQLALYQKVKI